MIINQQEFTVTQLQALRKRFEELVKLYQTDEITTDRFGKIIIEDGVVHAILQQDYEGLKRLTTSMWLDYYINVTPEFEIALTTADVIQQLSNMIAGLKSGYNDLQTRNKELEGQVATLIDSMLGDQAQLWSEVYKFDDVIEDVNRKYAKFTLIMHEVTTILQTVQEVLPDSTLAKRCAAQLKFIGEL